MNAYTLLNEYVDAATDLAEALREDLRKGDQISNDTILMLSSFMAAANKIKNLKMELKTKVRYHN